MLRAFACLIGASVLAACGTTQEPSSRLPARLVVTPTLDTIPVGASRQLRAIVEDGAGERIGGLAIHWRSSDSATAAVSDSGLVTGRGEGEVIVEASVEDLAAQATIVVPRTAVASVAVTPSGGELFVDGDRPLVIRVRDALGNKLSGRQVELVSSDTSVLAILPGAVITGRAAGVATVTATSEGVHARADFRVRYFAPSRIVAGSRHICVIEQRIMYCWGANDHGQLAREPGGAVMRPQRVEPSGERAVIALAAGHEHTCAVTDLHLAYCWGNNRSGGLGIGTNDDAAEPQFVHGGIRFVLVAAGGYHTCGLSTEGLAYCWGDNFRGQLGNGTHLVEQWNPVAVEGGHLFVGISVGYWHSCAWTTVGTLYCFGDNGRGQLGIALESPDDLFKTSPESVQTDLTFPAVASTGSARPDCDVNQESCWGMHVCGTAQNGRTYCWGDNRAGQLGADVPFRSTIPWEVTGGTAFPTVAAGTAHSCGIADQGVAWCWGLNDHGQLGTGDTVSTRVPVRVVGGHQFHAIAVGAEYTCALSNTGPAYCWGRNDAGQLGDGTTESHPTPMPIMPPTVNSP